MNSKFKTKNLKLVTLFIWLCLTIAVPAATVIYDTQQFTGAVLNRRITITLRTQGTMNGTNAIFGVPVVLQPVGGRATNSLLPAVYLLNIDQMSKTFVMPVPDSTNTYYAWDLVTAGASMDSPYPAIASGTNLSISTNYVGGFPIYTIEAQIGDLDILDAVRTNEPRNLALTNAANAFVGTFGGSGAGLSNVHSATVGGLLTNNTSGNAGTATLAATATTAIGAITATNVPGLGRGSILYVSTNGNDSTAIRGRPEFAWRNPHVAATNLLAGDTLRLEPGIYDVDTNGIVLANDSHLSGYGAEIISARDTFNSVAIDLGNNSIAEGFTLTCNTQRIQALVNTIVDVEFDDRAHTGFWAAFGSSLSGSPPTWGRAMTNALVRNVYVKHARTDCFVIGATNTTIRTVNSYYHFYWDAFASYNSVTNNGKIIAENCTFHYSGPGNPGIYNSSTNRIDMSPRPVLTGTVEWYNCNLIVEAAQSMVWPGSAGFKAYGGSASISVTNGWGWPGGAGNPEGGYMSVNGTNYLFERFASMATYIGDGSGLTNLINTYFVAASGTGPVLLSSPSATLNFSGTDPELTVTIGGTYLITGTMHFKPTDDADPDELGDPIVVSAFLFLPALGSSVSTRSMTVSTVDDLYSLGEQVVVLPSTIATFTNNTVISFRGQANPEPNIGTISATEAEFTLQRIR